MSRIGPLARNMVSAAEILKAIAEGVEDLGGSDGDLRRLEDGDNDHLKRQVARVLVSTLPSLILPLTCMEFPVRTGLSDTETYSDLYAACGGDKLFYFSQKEGVEQLKLPDRKDHPALIFTIQTFPDGDQSLRGRTIDEVVRHEYPRYVGRGTNVAVKCRPAKLSEACLFHEQWRILEQYELWSTASQHYFHITSRGIDIIESSRYQFGRDEVVHVLMVDEY